MKHLFIALKPAALVCVAGPALLAQVVLSGPAELLEGSTVTYTAALVGAENQPSWSWTLLSGGGVLDLREGLYTAPVNLLEPRSVTIQASSLDGKHTRQRVIRVLPDHREAGPFLQLLAGHPREKGARTGKGGDARFQNVVQAVWLGEGHPNPKFRHKWGLVDRGSHQILVMAADGTVEPWLGGSRAAGEHKESKSVQALFSDPAGMAVWPRGFRTSLGDPWRALVVEAGNHCVSQVAATEQATEVTVFAGKRKEHGHQDGRLDLARFCVPRGVAFGRDGAVFVADSGNGMIRKIHQGEVTTLAGCKQAFHERRQRDGRGGDACFYAPESLVVDPRTGDLYVSDLCAIRKVAMDGTVTTVAGILSNEASAFAPGFEAWLKQAPQEGKADRMAGIPCLNHPKGLAMAGRLLCIADHDNHAIRVLNVDTGQLATLAGHADHGRFSPGRPRVAGQLPEEHADAPAAGGYATLAYPNHVAFNPAGACLILQGPAPAGEETSCILMMKRDPRGGTSRPAPELPRQGAGEAKDTPKPGLETKAGSS